MRAVIQRVREARVGVDPARRTEPPPAVPPSESRVERRESPERIRGLQHQGSIGPGLCVLLGVARDDGEEEATRLAGKVARLRIFDNEEGRFDRSVVDAGGSALVVSQFTLVADTSKGNRPSFAGAAPPERGEALYETFCEALRAEGVEVATGTFGARMVVELANDGPVTIVLNV